MKLLTFIVAVGFVAATISACEAPWKDPPDYDAIFVSNRLVEWKISVSDENWLRLIVDPLSCPCELDGKGPNCRMDSSIPDLDCPSGCECQNGLCVTQYVEADVTVDGEIFGQVGLSIMGNKRRMKKTFRIRFNEFIDNQVFYGVKRINLKSNASDPTLIREALALELFRDAGVPSPRASFVWVTINGEAAGVYTLVEQVDKKFLEDRFGEDFGNLYKLERGGNLVYAGDNIKDYPNIEKQYELKTNEGEADPSGIIGLMRVLNESTDEELPARLDPILDLFGTLRMLAVNSWLSSMDSYPGAGGNLYLYQDRTGRFRTIPWDLNQAFGNYHGPSCAFTSDDLLTLDPDSPTCGGSRPLVDRLLAVDTLRLQYHEQIKELLNGVLRPGRVNQKIDALKALIFEPASDDISKDFSNEEFGASFTEDIPQGDNPVRVPGLQPFVRARDESIRERLGGF